jgi:stress response protein YsnF/sporulation protein YlmC with PRC-barrel domain
MANTKINHLEELDHSDYKIAEDQPKIDGWKIVNPNGEKIGKVKDLLFDKQALKVRYIVTDLKNGDLLDEDRKVLIPIGKARLNRDDERVEIPGVTTEQLRMLPNYKKTDDLTQEDEYTIRNAFSGTGSVGENTETYQKETFYDNEHYDEDKFYDSETGNEKMGDRTNDGKIEVVDEDLQVGKKEVKTGGARVKSRIVERPVEERINLNEEHVSVKRNPVDRPASGANLDNFEEETIKATETSEVPVVNKEARVVEEISLEKDVEEREEVIHDTERHTEVEIEDLDETDGLDDDTRRKRRMEKDDLGDTDDMDEETRRRKRRERDDNSGSGII